MSHVSTQQEIVIIGAGVTGCSVAYHLGKQGIPCLIIERDSIAARASGKSWAVFSYPRYLLRHEGEDPGILPSMSVGELQPWLELFWLGYHRLTDIALDLKENGGVDVGYSELPGIRVALSESEEKSLKAEVSSACDEGYCEASTWLEVKDLRTIYLGINPQARGGLLAGRPNLQVEPYQYTLGLAQAAEKMGAEILLREVVGFRTKGTKVTSVVLSTGSEIEADVFVLAMGPWNEQGTSWLGKEIPILINQEECLRLEVPRPLPLYSLSAFEGGVILPKANGTVVLGHSGLWDQRLNFDTTLKEETLTSLLNMATKLLPSLEEARVLEHRGDLMAWSPSPNYLQPVLGRLPKWDNAYVAARIPYGMMLSPGVGQVMADLIINEGRPAHRFKNMLEYLSPARLEPSD